MALQIPTGNAGNIAPQMSSMLQQLMQQRYKPQELDLQRQEQNRLGALLPYQKRQAQLQTEALERANDPAKALAYRDQWMQAMQNYQQPGMQPGSQPGASAPAQPGSQQGTSPPAQPVMQQGGSQQQAMPPQQQNEPMLMIAGRPMPLSMAQVMASVGAPIGGLQETLKNYYEQQKTLGQETSKAEVSREGERGDALSALQDGLQAVGRIRQKMDNYSQEAKDLGYTPHYGMGAEQRTEPDALERYKGRSKQIVGHPVESVMHPLDWFTAFGAGPGSEMHDRHLASLRSELNELVNVRAKALNTKFTDKEYDTLQRNKPSIGDTEAQLKAKLKAVEESFRNGILKLQMQEQKANQGARPGQEAFQVENQFPSEHVGRAVTGASKPVGSEGFKSDGYEYVVHNGKTYRKKVRS